MQIKITKKEKNILVRVAQGKTNKCISNELNIALPTVEQYLRILMGKIPSSNRAQLVYEAVKNGIIE